ncbi:Hit family protein 1 [Symbiodinium microadriaticum]|uniref:Hit family protein 1 n=1 Tax=Symbiodinium microadriaticum TaxID=2951 RepID=A0A1Q9DWC2_SYMMI|nr:Hit family protein 1 [Symbiodinium microadriaticum]
MSHLKKGDDNVFSKIIDGTIPCFKIFETEDALAFLDAFPKVKGHAVLIPKRKGFLALDGMFGPESEPLQTGQAMQRQLSSGSTALRVLLPRLCKAVKRATGCQAVNVISNLGADDDNMLTMAPSATDMVDKDEATETATEMKNALKSIRRRTSAA